MRVPRRLRRGWLLLALLALLLVVGGLLGRRLVVMPGRSRDATDHPPTTAQRELADTLRRDVGALSVGIGPRHAWRPEAAALTVRLLVERLSATGREPRLLRYEHPEGTSVNVELELRGTQRPEEIVVVGAHYDTVPIEAFGGAVAGRGCPGADDNASGVAALLALAERFARRTPARTLRFVCFANEEPPSFRSEAMGSRVYARACRARGEDVVAMLSLESIGYYSDEPGSQRYPPFVGWLYPDRGDFVAFVSDLRSRRLLRRCVGAFRRRALLPSEGGALPAFLPGVAWSDHWSFWRSGYRAVMVTDTAPFRNPHYHTAADTLEDLDFHRLALVVEGLVAVVEDLVRAE